MAVRKHFAYAGNVPYIVVIGGVCLRCTGAAALRATLCWTNLSSITIAPQHHRPRGTRIRSATVHASPTALASILILSIYCWIAATRNCVARPPEIEHIRRRRASIEGGIRTLLLLQCLLRATPLQGGWPGVVGG